MRFAACRVFPVTLSKMITACIAEIYTAADRARVLPGGAARPGRMHRPEVARGKRERPDGDA